MQLSPNVFLMQNGIVNVYLIVEGSNLLLIDSGLRGFAPTVLRQINKLGLIPGSLKIILLTHSDSDHTGSAAELRDLTGAKIMTSGIEAAAVALGKASRELTPKGMENMFYGAVSGLFRAAPFKVDQELSLKDSFPFLGGLQVVATPGHTPGHLSFFSPSTGFLFAGDSIRIIGRKTAPSSGGNTWNADIAAQSYKLQMDLKPKSICAGHGLLLPI